MQTPNHCDKRSWRAIGTFLTIIIVLTVLMMSIVTSVFARPLDSADLGAVDAASIWLDGPSQGAPDEIITYNIATDASGLYGAQLELSFDPAVLQVVGTQITPGSCPKPDFIVSNSVDNGAGSISYAATALAPTLPCDGGIIASFQFQVSPTAPKGSTQVQFASVILADSNGLEIPVTTVDLNLEIIGVFAEFSGTPTSGRAPLTVNFTNLSSGDYDSCTWDFGDSSGSSSCGNQNHVYAAPGSYTVQLSVSGPGGSDNETKADYIVVWQYWLNLPVILR